MVIILKLGLKILVLVLTVFILLSPVGCSSKQNTETIKPPEPITLSDEQVKKPNTEKEESDQQNNSNTNINEATQNQDKNKGVNALQKYVGLLEPIVNKKKIDSDYEQIRKAFINCITSPSSSNLEQANALMQNQISYLTVISNTSMIKGYGMEQTWDDLDLSIYSYIKSMKAVLNLIEDNDRNGSLRAITSLDSDMVEVRSQINTLYYTITNKLKEEGVIKPPPPNTLDFNLQDKIVQLKQAGYSVRMEDIRIVHFINNEESFHIIFNKYQDRAKSIDLILKVDGQGNSPKDYEIILKTVFGQSYTEQLSEWVFSTDVYQKALKEKGSGVGDGSAIIGSDKVVATYKWTSNEMLITILITPQH